MEALFIKIGGSFITHKSKPVSVNYSALDSLTSILKTITLSRQDIILGNGGGSFAHHAVFKYGLGDRRELLVRCHQATRLLNRIIVDYLVANGLMVTSVQTSAIISYDPSSKEFRIYSEPLETILNNRIIPVVYGECIPTQGDPMIISTERVFELIARRIRPKRVILLTDVKGVYTCDPRICHNPVLIKEITPANLDRVLDILKEHEKSDATGGIYSKVLYMSRFASAFNTEVLILSGFDVDAVIEASRGGYPEHSTLITYK